MDYSGTISRGWGIVWKNKWLVLLTLLPLLLTSVAGSLVFAANPVMFDPTAAPEEIMARSGSLLLLSCLSALLYLVGTVLYLGGHAGQIAAVARLARGEATGFGPSFREGLRATPRLIALGIVLYGIPIVLFIVGLFVVLVPMSLLAFAGETSQSSAAPGLLGLILLCCLYLLYVLVLIVAAAVFALGTRGIVLRKLGVFEALRHGWRVLRENLGQVILLALPFAVVYVLLAIVVYAVMFVVLFRDMIANPLMMGAGDGMYGRVLLLTLLYILPTVVVYAWQSATVTLAYLKWTGKDVLGAGLGTDDAPSWSPPAEPPLV